MESNLFFGRIVGLDAETSQYYYFFFEFRTLKRLVQGSNKTNFSQFLFYIHKFVIDTSMEVILPVVTEKQESEIRDEAKLEKNLHDSSDYQDSDLRMKLKGF